jgi:hypothetical protein
MKAALRHVEALHACKLRSPACRASTWRTARIRRPDTALEPHRTARIRRPDTALMWPWRNGSPTDVCLGSPTARIRMAGSHAYGRLAYVWPARMRMAGSHTAPWSLVWKPDERLSERTRGDTRLEQLLDRDTGPPCPLQSQLPRVAVTAAFLRRLSAD